MVPLQWGGGQIADLFQSIANGVGMLTQRLSGGLDIVAALGVGFQGAQQEAGGTFLVILFQSLEGLHHGGTHGLVPERGENGTIKPQIRGELDLGSL